MRRMTDGMKIMRLGHGYLPVRTGDARIQVVRTDLRLRRKARTKGDDHGYSASDP